MGEFANLKVTYPDDLAWAAALLDAARRAIGFRLTADADQFLTIAKFRALRKLWARRLRPCLKPPLRLCQRTLRKRAVSRRWLI